MNHKKRTPLGRLSINQQLNLHSNSFLPNSTLTCPLNLNQKADNRLSTTSPIQQNQSGTFDLKYNEAIDLFKQSVNAQALSPCVVSIQRKYKSGFRSKNKQNIYVKISQLIKNEEQPVSTSNKSNHFTPKERPRTSISARPRYSLDQSYNKFNVVLQLSKPINQSIFDQSARISTSRALMNYSKVYKNASNDRFKVKKNKNLTIPKFAQLSAQKVVFSEKEKRQKKDIRKPTLRQMLNYRVQSRTKGLNRYAEDDQQFQIAGWDIEQ